MLLDKATKNWLFVAKEGGAAQIFIFYSNESRAPFLVGGHSRQGNKKIYLRVPPHIAIPVFTILSACTDSSQTGEKQDSSEANSSEDSSQTVEKQDSSEDSSEDSSQTGEKQDSLIDVAEINKNFEKLSGKSVLVRNDVVKPIGERGLILDEDQALNDQNILVIDISQTPLKLSNKQTPEILVKGKVEKLNLSELEQKYSLNLDPNIYSQYEQKPVIIAEWIMLSPDPGDLVLNPENYYDQQLAIKGEVEDIKNYGGFELDEERVVGGEDLLVNLLVILAKTNFQPNEDQMVIVYGFLRPFVAAEFEKDYNLGWDLSVQQQIEAEYSQKPVLAAEKIQVVED